MEKTCPKRASPGRRTKNKEALKGPSNGDEEVGYFLAVSKPILFFDFVSSPGQHRVTRRPTCFNRWVAADIVASNSECCHEGNDECHLIVTYETHQQQQPGQQLNSEEGYFKIQTQLFSGTLSGIYCEENRTSIQQDSDESCSDESIVKNPKDFKKKRSDISLLLGAALHSQKLGHIKIESVQILLHKDVEEEKAQGLPPSRCQLLNGTVLLTISIPDIEYGALSRERSKREIHSVTQLLFSLVETNWDLLEESLPTLELQSSQLSRSHEQQEGCDESLKGNGILKTKAKSNVFPTALSLENVYKKIQDMHDRPSIVTPSSVNAACLDSSSAADSVPSLQGLPRDLIVGHIAPYLRSKSLYALRCSCKLFYTMLEEYVPGMKLKLYQHQCRSLDWMQTREHRLQPTASKEDEYDFIRRGTASVELVLATRHKPRTFYKCDTITGSISIVENDNTEKHIPALNVMRGGLLCDDAGLGKTITVLSLILRTLGQSTHNVEQKPKKSIGRLIFYLCWETLNCNEKKQELMSLHNQIRKQDKFGYFDLPVSLIGYTDVVSTPICMADIRQKINQHEYGIADGFRKFRDDFYLMYRNATTFHPVQSLVYAESVRLRHIFKRIVREFMNRCTDMVQRRAKQDLQDSIKSLREEEKISEMEPTAATLLVVPMPLLDHWRYQMMKNIDFSYVSCKIPLIFHHRSLIGENHGYLDSEFRYHTSSIIDADQRCGQKDSTHCAAVFIDHEPTLTLPSHNFISKFFVVLTTNQRLSNAWKNGRVEKEERLCVSRSQQKNPRSNVVAPLYTSSVCPFLKVNWLRLVVDEGHTMGKGCGSNAVQFSSWIISQRRWAMTGTPTPQTNRSSDLRNILGLMKFLRHVSFSSDALWKNAISKSWNEDSLVGYFRLCHLLSLLMRRHTKDSIPDLPPPCFKLTYTELSPNEILAYNTLTTVIQSNILITSMKAKISAWEDSLLNPKQAKYANQALQNVRLSCCGGTNLLPTLSEKSWNDTMYLLKIEHMADDIKTTIVDKFLRTATRGGVTSCRLCGIQLQQLLVLPCGDLLCSQCLVNDVNVCPICSEEFDADEFQELQPGFNVTWRWNVENEKTNCAQPAAHERNPPSVRRRKIREPHVCNFSKSDPGGPCLICREEHLCCDMVNEKLECATCYRKAEECPDEETKSTYIISRLLELIDQQKYNSACTIKSEVASRTIGNSIKTKQPRALKVIIFSQFRKILNVVGDRLLRRLGGAVVAEFWGGYRDEELKKFKTSPRCVCMLLGRDGAHGLDLSFVTNIIFLDEIYDKSVKHQVISRAYRMGAEGSVEVEQLIAKNSIEEVMATMNETDEEECTVNSASSRNSKKNVKSGPSCSKLHFLLKNLRLIHPNLEAVTSRKRPLGVEAREDADIASKSKQSRVRFCD